MSDAQLSMSSSTPVVSRRCFLGAGAASLLCGVFPLGHPSRLAASSVGADARLAFRQVRARPGHWVLLDVDPGLPHDAVQVALAHRAPSGALTPLGLVEVRLQGGTGSVEVEVPMRALLADELSREAFELVALLLTDAAELVLASAPLEVVVSPFAFGL